MTVQLSSLPVLEKEGGGVLSLCYPVICRDPQPNLLICTLATVAFEFSLESWSGFQHLKAEPREELWEQQYLP